MEELLTADDRIRAAREAAGLTEEEAAERIGLSLPWYRDLASDPSEAFMTISLAHLRVLGRVVGVPPRVLLTGDATPPPVVITFSELAARLDALRAAEGISVAELSERVGRELGDVLVDPEALWSFNVDGLRDVCRAARVDWLAALPD